MFDASKHDLLFADPWGAAAVGLVVAFLALTLAFQYRAFADPISRYDVLRLLPRWTFFAPNPATRDVHLLISNLLESGTETDWDYLNVAPGRGQYDPLWNPGKRARKILSDCVNALKRIRSRGTADDVLKYYIPYLVLLNAALTSRRPDAVAVRFCIVETTGRINRRLRIYYTSEFHRVSRND